MHDNPIAHPGKIPKVSVSVDNARIIQIGCDMENLAKFAESRLFIPRSPKTNAHVFILTRCDKIGEVVPTTRRLNGV
jgi:methyl coenzyme M reductase subunit C